MFPIFIFTEWGPNRRMHFCRRAAVSAGSKTADAVCRSGLACEKIPENPQIFRNSNIKIMFPLNMARVQRRPFEMYG